jgi:HPt (histidine-containing phosphotransfer) domain-containing protein
VTSFLRDASRSLAVLGTLCTQQGAWSDEDLQSYTVNIHGIKSALANIGERELSSRAFSLEQAGRTRDLAVMASDTPDFLQALQEVITRLTPQEAGATCDGDPAYLRATLPALQAACAAYDKKAARALLSDLGQKAWPRPTQKLLDSIAGHLLHSEFKKIARIVDEMLATP